MTGAVEGAPSGALAIEVAETAADAGALVAEQLVAAIAAATAAGRAAVLGCPAGRTPRPAYAALATLAAERELDLSGVQIVLMDEFVLDTDDGFRRCPPDAHFSCRGAIELDLLGRVDAELPPAHRLRRSSVHLPDPEDPRAYDELIDDLGGIDVFLLASGASDGHVAFNPPGTSIDAGTRIVRLADSTRHDNLSTFPGFGSIDDVPCHGVSIGLGTIVRASRSVVLLLTGAAKHDSHRRITTSTAFDPAWPATVVHRCRRARVVADRCAADGTAHLG